MPVPIEHLEWICGLSIAFDTTHTHNLFAPNSQQNSKSQKIGSIEREHKRTHKAVLFKKFRIKQNKFY